MASLWLDPLYLLRTSLEAVTRVHFGGHRARAVALIDQAQEELRKALDFDRNH